MFADHHVLRVREALMGVEGVETVVASAARRMVVVEHDAAAAQALSRALAEAGHPVEASVELDPALPPSKDGSAWYTVIQRITDTQRKDLEMSGDFRRY